MRIHDYILSCTFFILISWCSRNPACNRCTSRQLHRFAYRECDGIVWQPITLFRVKSYKFLRFISGSGARYFSTRAQFLETARFVEDRSESQGSRFQDHRSYEQRWPGRMHMRVSAWRRKRANVRENERPNEKGRAEVEDVGERRTRSIRRPLSVTSLSTSRSRTGIACWTWRHRSNIPSSFTCRSSSFSRYRERIPGMLISVSGNNAH